MRSIAFERKQWNSSWGKKSSFPPGTLCLILHFLVNYGKHTTNDPVGNVARNHISIGIEPMFIMKFKEALTMHTISKERWMYVFYRICL